MSTSCYQEGPPIAEIYEILGQERFCSYLEVAARYVSKEQIKENV